MRVVCILAEQVYCGWLRTFTADSIRRFSKSAGLSPWSGSAIEIRPTNWSQPILQAAHLTKGPSPVTPEEHRQRLVDLKWLRKFQETVEQREARVLHETAYKWIVTRPVESMRRSQVPESEVRRYMNVANEVVNSFAPPKSAYKFETATRVPEKRAAEEMARNMRLSKKRLYSAVEEKSLRDRRDDRKQDAKRRKDELANSTMQDFAEFTETQEYSLVAEKKGRKTTLQLPFWGCLAKTADELTEDYGFRPREQFNRYGAPPEKGKGLWEH